MPTNWMQCLLSGEAWRFFNESRYVGHGIVAYSTLSFTSFFTETAVLLFDTLFVNLCSFSLSLSFKVGFTIPLNLSAILSRLFLIVRLIVVPIIKAKNVQTILITLKGILKSGTGGIMSKAFEYMEVVGLVLVIFGWHENVTMEGHTSKPRLGPAGKASKFKYFGL